ncbi:MAG: MotA/TolQ/ExbB proton channel family protein [Pseudomonadota bacterium]
MSSLISPILDFVQLGGPVVAILLCLSIGALAMIVLKAMQFVRCRVGQHRRAKRALNAWNHRKRIEAINDLKGTKSAVGKSLLVCMENINRGKVYKEDLEDEVSTVAIRELHELQRGFRTLEAISQIAPLLGLFGTVLGMIDAFQKLQSAGSSVDPSILAGGIWVALLTTAAGLAVAMPVSLVLTWFETRLEDERVAIQTMTADLINQNVDALQDDQAHPSDTFEVAYAG